MGSREHISFLAGSESRVRVLEALRDRPHHQSELVRECDLSRSTVHRALDGLTDREWVCRDDGTFHLTASGALVLERYDALETTVGRVVEWGSFLNRLGAVARTLPPTALDDATLVSATPENPHAALTRFVDAFSDTGERFRGISPVVSPVTNEAASELVTAGVDVELVVDDSVLEASLAAYPEALDDAYEFENVELFRHPADLEFGLAVLDDRVLVAGYDDHGVLEECLDGTGDALYEWATETYDEHRAAAERVDSPASEPLG